MQLLPTTTAAATALLAALLFEVGTLRVLVHARPPIRYPDIHAPVGVDTWCGAWLFFLLSDDEDEDEEEEEEEGNVVDILSLPE